MHRDRDLRFQLLQDLARCVRRHGERSADGDHRNIDLAECFNLFLGEFVAQVAEVRDAKGAEVENKGRAFQGVAELLLIDGDALNQDIADGGADFIRLRAVIA